MPSFSLGALHLTKLEVSVSLIAGFAFIILFVISSAQGGYKDLVDTTLKNDQTRRLGVKNKH